MTSIFLHPFWDTGNSPNMSWAVLAHGVIAGKTHLHWCSSYPAANIGTRCILSDVSGHVHHHYERAHPTPQRTVHPSGAHVSRHRRIMIINHEPLPHELGEDCQSVAPTAPRPKPRPHFRVKTPMRALPTTCNLWCAGKRGPPRPQVLGRAIRPAVGPWRSPVPVHFGQTA